MSCQGRAAVPLPVVVGWGRSFPAMTASRPANRSGSAARSGRRPRRRHGSGRARRRPGPGVVRDQGQQLGGVGRSGEPDRVRQFLGDQPVQVGVGGPGAIDPDQDPLPGSGRCGPWAVLEPTFPARRVVAKGSPVPAGPWSANAHSGWKPKPACTSGGPVPCPSARSPTWHLGPLPRVSGVEVMVGAPCPPTPRPAPGSRPGRC